jgi:uncharacterized lipoprotein YmbA
VRTTALVCASILLLASTALLACSSEPRPETVRYLMRPSAESRSGQAEATASVGLRRVAVAPYLMSDGLVLETQQNEIRSARYHQWAEPLEYGLRSLLQGELSAQLGYAVDDNAILLPDWHYSLDVDVDQLHGTSAGEALLVASWRLTALHAPGDSASERVDERHFFRATQPLPREGYAALVETEIALVRQLAAAIAESVQALAASER